MIIMQKCPGSLWKSLRYVYLSLQGFANGVLDVYRVLDNYRNNRRVGQLPRESIPLQRGRIERYRYQNKFTNAPDISHIITIRGACKPRFCERNNFVLLRIYRNSTYMIVGGLLKGW